MFNTGIRGMESATSGSVTDIMAQIVEVLCLTNYHLKMSQGMRRGLMTLHHPASASSRSLVLSKLVRYVWETLKTT